MQKIRAFLTSVLCTSLICSFIFLTACYHRYSREIDYRFTNQDNGTGLYYLKHKYSAVSPVFQPCQRFHLQLKYFHFKKLEREEPILFIDTELSPGGVLSRREIHTEVPDHDKQVELLRWEVSRFSGLKINLQLKKCSKSKEHQEYILEVKELFNFHMSLVNSPSGNNLLMFGTLAEGLYVILQEGYSDLTEIWENLYLKDHQLYWVKDRNRYLASSYVVFEIRRSSND